VIGLDTSYLVGLAIREHPSHRACRRLFESEIVGKVGSTAIAAQALAEFCHVVTDPRRFERPFEMSEALEICEQWWHAEECRPAPVDSNAGALFVTWMHQHRLGRKHLLDTLLAATYHCLGVHRLASTNWRDFERYGAFDVIRIS